MAGAPIRLGIDAVAGDATRRIAECVADNGVVVSYGSMSGEECVMSRAAMAMRGVSLIGFMLGRGLGKRTPERVLESALALVDACSVGETSRA